MDIANRRLMWHGMFLFLLGLLTGFAEPLFSNMRMGLAAHLEGVMNGIFLLTLGVVWIHVRLSPLVKKVAYWVVLYGTYGNWFVTTLAAIFGTAAFTDNRSRTQGTSLARRTCSGWISYGRRHDSRFLSAPPVGSSRQRVGGSSNWFGLIKGRGVTQP